MVDEESSALSGIDFVTQPRAKVTFLPGSRTASLFVKVLDDSARRQAPGSTWSSAGQQGHIARRLTHRSYAGVAR